MKAQPLPCPLDEMRTWSCVRALGPNVHVYRKPDKTRMVCKSFDYWARANEADNEADGKERPSGLQWNANLCDVPLLRHADQRHPPPQALMRALSKLAVTGIFYDQWQVQRHVPNVALLTYPWVKTDRPGPHLTVQLQQVFAQLKVLHENGFVHGDILQRNILFCPSFQEGQPAAFLIDFDLGRYVNTRACYVATFNTGGDLERYRHKEAKPNLELKYEHDGFALARVVEDMLQDDEHRTALVSAIEELDLDRARTLVVRCKPKDGLSQKLEATGSPPRPALRSPSRAAQPSNTEASSLANVVEE